MAIGSHNWLGLTDYLVIGSSFVICIAIGWFSHRNKPNGDQMTEFVLAGRKMPLIPAALSAFATSNSAYVFIGKIGEIFRYGIWFVVINLAMALPAGFLAYTVVPVFHRAKYVSVFEFFEERFDRTVRKIASMQYIVTSAFYLGMVLYVPSISVCAVSGLPYWVVVLLGGGLCSLYCTLGGFRAVIWTDVFQATVMFALLVVITYFGVFYVGGLQAVFERAFNGTMAEEITLIETETTRYSIWSLLTYGLVASVTSFANQASMQRILCVGNVKLAQQSYLLGVGTALLFNTMVLLFGVVVIAAFATCDPLKIPLDTGVTSNDHIFIYSATEFLGQYPGLLGLSLIGLISASLSSYSSFLNALSATTLQDFLKPAFNNFYSHENHQMWTLRFLTVFYGAITTLFSFLVPYLGGVVKYTISIKDSSDGVVAGLLMLSIFSRRTNGRVSKISYFLGLAAVIALAVTSNLIEVDYDSLPHTTIDCPFNSSFVFESEDLNVTEVNIPWLKNVSVIWFPPIAFGVTILSAHILSYFLGNSGSPDEHQSAFSKYQDTLLSKSTNKSSEMLTLKTISSENEKQP